MIKQRTLANSIAISGVGLHSGNSVNLKLIPAPANSGLVFRRTDLSPPIEIKPTHDLVKETAYCTCLINDYGDKVQTIEHLFSALAAFGIDNLIIEIDSGELPILDGSALGFVFLFKETGVVDLDVNKKFIKIKEPIKVILEDKSAELYPLKDPQQIFKLDFEISFDHQAITDQTNTFSFTWGLNDYIESISRARTFGFLEQIEYLQGKGLCLGGSLDNSVVLDRRSIINPEGLRYPNELVRHKILDAIGDLYVCGFNIIGGFRAYKSGHGLNNILLRKLMQSTSSWEYVELDVNNHPQFQVID